MFSRPINLAIADDHALFRKTLKSFLSDQKDFNVVIQVSNVFDLFRKLKEVHVDVLLIDMYVPELNGNEAIKAICGQYPEMKVLVLSMNTDIAIISHLQNAGIHGYISKFDEPDDLLEAIFTVLDGSIYRNDIFTEALYCNMQHNIAFASKDAILLSEREKKVLQLLWEEKSNKEIADELFLGVRSVEKIRLDMKEKVGVKSTIGLLKYAIANKIITVDLKRSDLLS